MTLHSRRAILHRVAHSEKAMTELAEPFDRSLVAVSKHVKVLERAGLVERRWHGNYSYLKLNPEALLTADQWLENYRKFWEQSLDRLENYLKDTQKKQN